jgi:hypothetical protein
MNRRVAPAVHFGPERPVRQDDDESLSAGRLSKRARTPVQRFEPTAPGRTGEIKILTRLCRLID